MNLLDISPLLSFILGLLLGIFILSRKSGLGSDKRIRYILGILVFLYAYTSFDYYLILKIGIDSMFTGGAYMLYHLTGPSILCFHFTIDQIGFPYKKDDLFL